jgi:hypothetical protein
MRLRNYILGMLLAGAAALAQPVQNVAVVPECQIFLSTAVPALPVNSVSWDNRTRACDRWVVTYTAYGFAGPLSLAVQSSADNAGAPAAWVNFAGTVVSGINPNTAITQALTSLSGYYPWMKMTLTATGAGAGMVTATLYGYKDRPASVVVAGTISVQGSAAPGAAPGNPIVTGGLGSGAAGGLVAGSTVCDLSAPIAVAAAGNTEIVALTAGRSIRVCHLSLSMQAPVDIALVRAPAGACAGPVNVTGIYSTVLALSMDFVNGPVVLPAANALCINLGQAVTGGGMVTYAVY